jgi:pyridinium-3,5-biscarboxylic acid mononucleotide sulfurtransferase
MESLRALVRTFPSALLGYSGGVDSALLAVVLRQELGKDRMVAAIGRSASYPEAQWQAAIAVANQFDIPLVEIHTHELEDANYLANPTNRCFYCKTELWNRLVPLAHERGLAVVCDGTNADDVNEHRPGKAAGVKAGVRSPLAEAGLTKAEIRAASREIGLPTWDAPAAPCLSSRVQYGLSITPARLRQVEQGEAFLRSLGVRGDLRLRHHDAVARIEVEPTWIEWLEERRATITDHLTTLGFARVEIDPRGYRRGSLLERSSR